MCFSINCARFDASTQQPQPRPGLMAIGKPGDRRSQINIPDPAIRAHALGVVRGARGLKLLASRFRRRALSVGLGLGLGLGLGIRHNRHAGANVATARCALQAIPGHFAVLSQGMETLRHCGAVLLRYCDAVALRSGGADGPQHYAPGSRYPSTVTCRVHLPL